MLAYLVADDILAGLGQISAILLCLYILVSTLIGLAVAAGLAFGLTWVREKVELIKILRPVVDSVNTTTESAIKGTLPAAGTPENKIIRTVAAVPAVLHTVDNRVEQGGDRVAQAVIEFHARKEMVKSIAQTFFLPGLKGTTSASSQIEGPEK